uniref:Reverse transcriptase domain-containing protein n=1 Tax=Paramormyrops kingsleyae TaxID=1676925 RepID=A0A3B3SI74_9TELE
MQNTQGQRWRDLRQLEADIGNRTSASIITNTGVPQGCVLSPILYTLFTHDCVATSKDNIILKFADDTAVIGRITGGDETAYRREVAGLVSWCEDNNLTLNTDKTKEMIVDMGKTRSPRLPLFIRELEVERVSSFKYLGIYICEDLTWTLNTTQLVKKAQQRLYFLRRLRKFGMSRKILSNFYSCIVESTLTSCITAWYGSTTAMDRKRLQRVITTAEKIIRTPLPSLQSIYHRRALRRAASILKDPTHPQHGLFTLLPSGRRFRSVKSRTSRLNNSFFPTTIRLLNRRPTSFT